jgi:hypothetical protein
MASDDHWSCRLTKIGKVQFEEVVTLYDLTNTYFEGQSLDNELGALGCSKEKRSDCMLVLSQVNIIMKSRFAKFYKQGIMIGNFLAIDGDGVFTR